MDDSEKRTLREWSDGTVHQEISRLEETEADVTSSRLPMGIRASQAGDLACSIKTAVKGRYGEGVVFELTDKEVLNASLESLLQDLVYEKLETTLDAPPSVC